MSTEARFIESLEIEAGTFNITDEERILLISLHKEQKMNKEMSQFLTFRTIVVNNIIFPIVISRHHKNNKSNYSVFTSLKVGIDAFKRDSSCLKKSILTLILKIVKKFILMSDIDNIVYIDDWLVTKVRSKASAFAYLDKIECLLKNEYPNYSYVMRNIACDESSSAAVRWRRFFYKKIYIYKPKDPAQNYIYRQIHVNKIYHKNRLICQDEETNEFNRLIENSYGGYNTTRYSLTNNTIKFFQKNKFIYSFSVLKCGKRLSTGYVFVKDNTAYCQYLGFTEKPKQTIYLAIMDSLIYSKIMDKGISMNLGGLSKEYKKKRYARESYVYFIIYTQHLTWKKRFVFYFILNAYRFFSSGI